jgi:hypothetical protein
MPTELAGWARRSAARTRRVSNLRRRREKAEREPTHRLHPLNPGAKAAVEDLEYLPSSVIPVPVPSSPRPDLHLPSANVDLRHHVLHTLSFMLNLSDVPNCLEVRRVDRLVEEEDEASVLREVEDVPASVGLVDEVDGQAKLFCRADYGLEDGVELRGRHRRFVVVGFEELG